MPSSNRTAPAPTAPRGEGAARPGRRLNRSERRAMEVRAAASGSAATPAVIDRKDEVVASGPTGSMPVRAPQVRRANARTRPQTRVTQLTREQEFGFIQSDLRRVIIYSGILLAAMFVVLAVLNM